jgi:hypothetical protein
MNDDTLRPSRFAASLAPSDRGEHPFAEIQAFALRYAPVDGITELAHLDGELA